MNNDDKYSLITPSNIFLGGFSLLIGTFLAHKIYKKLDNFNWDRVVIPNSDSEELDKVNKCKEQGYLILINTILDYNKKKPEGNFRDFMKEMWTEDYNILLKSESGDESIKRNYSGWEKLFNEIKNIEE
jgi:type III secretory pathway component EscR